MTPEEKRARKREELRRWKQQNPDKVREQRRRSYEKNRDKRRAYARKWAREYSKRRLAEHPEETRAKWRAQYHRRRQADPKAARARWRQQYVKKRRREGQRIYSAAAAAVPASLPRHVRDDVVAALVLGVIERRYTVESLPAQAKREIAAHSRQFDHFKTLSLDAPIAGTELRRVDTIAADALHF
jgi:hypothetical protein